MNTYRDDRGNIVDASGIQEQLYEEAKERSYRGQKKMSEEEYMEVLYPREHDEYLVDGAVLKCTMATPEMKILKGKIYKVNIPNNRTVLNVTENQHAKCCEDLCHATIFDSKKDKNIKPFRCNCKNDPHNGEEWRKIYSCDSLPEEGTCGALMNLNPTWDNFTSNVPYLVFSDDEHGVMPGINMTSILFCRHGGIIYPVTSGQWYVTPLLEEMYEIMEKWLLEGYAGVSEEELLYAMDYLALFGEQNKVSALNKVDIQTIIRNKQNEGKMIDETEQSIYDRINDCINNGQSEYDNMILAWTNYWNMTMANEYGRGNYSPVRADVVKAMILVESNLGEPYSSTTEIKEILANRERDIMQSLDCRNPVFWKVANIAGNGKTIEIEFAEEDSKRFNIASSVVMTLSMEDGGSGERSYYGNGTWNVIYTLFSKENNIYYAGNVTPEMSIAIGIAEYCKELNGAGTNDGVSTLKCEEIAVKGYNGGGDSVYTYKVNLVLENMGVDILEKTN